MEKTEQEPPAFRHRSLLCSRSTYIRRKLSRRTRCKYLYIQNM